MIKTSLFITFLCLVGTAFAQPSCQHKHQAFELLNTKAFKSSEENLRSDTIDVLNYSIYLDFTEIGSSNLKANCKVHFETKMDVNTLSLDLLQMNIDSIVFQGSSTSYNYNDTLIVIDFGSTLTAGTEDSVTVYYNGSPQTDPSGWGGFYTANGYYYNLGVGFASIPHNYGRVWHPCFDNFTERATYDFEILTNNNETAYCNGTRTNVQSVGTDSLLTNWELSTAIPTYLASVAVSDYTHVEDSYYSGLQSTSFPIWLVAHAADTANMKSSFLNLNGAMAAYEMLYGPYVWERIGYVSVPFNAGAMEHATNIAYPQLTLNGTLQFETLMAHELSHSWWGNWVTCNTAQEMWINEGMAVFSEHTFLEAIYGEDAYMEEVKSNLYDVLHKVHIDDSGHFALNAVPLNVTYGTHSYYKGASVIHSMRGYINNDSLFFDALHAVQTQYGGDNASSEEFRDAMNSVAGVDVTQFFEDWIFQSGFTQFSIAQFNSSENGGSWNVELLIDQKLRGAANLYTDVPMQVTFMDADWNTYSTDLVLGGDFQTENVSVPFEPVFAALNMDQRINHAVTAVDTVITASGIKNLSQANARLSITGVTDSAFVRVEHNWVYADDANMPNVITSIDRYWEVKGIGLENLEGKIRLNYNAQQTAAGDLDNGLMVDAGGQVFNEDSLLLLYRPDGMSEWQIHPDYTLNNSSNPLDKIGYFEANGILAGQYCFGYKVYSVGTEELSHDLSYSIYPNPTDDSVFIDLTQFPASNYSLELHAIDGAVVATYQLNGATKNALQIGDVSHGTFIAVIRDQNGISKGSKRVVVR